MKRIILLLVAMLPMLAIAQNNVTFQVDLSQYGGTYTTPTVNGTFNGWSGVANPLTDMGNGIWQTTVSIPAGQIEYKFAYDDWTGQEQFVGGEPCTFSAGGFTNRVHQVTADEVLPVVCWNACTSCSSAPVNGDITFSVDMSQYPGTFTTVYVSGLFNGWSGVANPLTDIGNGIWEATIPNVPAGQTEYKFTVDDWAAQENFVGGEPCTVTNSGFTNRSLTINGNATVNTVCWNSCTTCGASGPQLAQIDLPITWDDTANVDYSTTDFGGNASQVVVDPTNPNNLVLEVVKGSGSQTWAGTTFGTGGPGQEILASQIPFATGATTITAVVWSPTAGIPVQLKAEVGGTPTQSVETVTNTTVAGAWETLVFDFANERPGTAPIDFSYNYDMLSVFFNFDVAGAGNTYYLDDVYFGTASPSLAQIDLPITWDDVSNVDYSTTDFGGNTSQNVVDPTDPSNMVLEVVKGTASQTWAGTTFGTGPAGQQNLASLIPFAPGATTITAVVWSPNAGIPVQLKAEVGGNPTQSVETVTNTTKAGEWDTLVFDFSNERPGTAPIDFSYNFNMLSIFFNFDNVGAGNTYYVDDVFFGGTVVNPPSTHNVTFRVDMSEYGGTFTTPEVNGLFNGWCGNCNPLTDADGDNIWETTIAISEDSTEYKFSYDNWAGQEMLVDGSVCTKTTAGNTNRFIQLSGDTILPAVCWESCAECTGNPTPMHDVTFKVDMNQYTGTFTTPEVNGVFNGWCGSCNPMTDADGDNVWETTISIEEADSIEYKFSYDNWTGQEELTEGDPCTITTTDASGTFTNRMFNLSSDTTMIAVCWESCSECEPLSVEDLQNSGIKVMPNPASDVATVTFENGANSATVEIYNLNGALVKNIRGFQSGNTIGLNDLSKGVYILNVRTENAVAVQKLIIK